MSPTNPNRPFSESQIFAGNILSKLAELKSVDSLKQEDLIKLCRIGQAAFEAEPAMLELKAPLNVRMSFRLISTQI